mgnify:CR=1 FL=1
MESSKYNAKERVREYQEKIIKLVDYILFCYSKGYMSEKTKDGLLRIINPEIYAKLKR